MGPRAAGVYGGNEMATLNHNCWRVSFTCQGSSLANTNERRDTSWLIQIVVVSRHARLEKWLRQESLTSAWTTPIWAGITGRSAAIAMANR